MLIMRNHCYVTTNCPFFPQVLLLTVVGVAVAQYEAGHVKILQDKRYQEGAAFGNYRNQEDGIKYQEETDQNGIRRGFWEYPDETGKILRVEFEAGAGIGFRVTNSNYLAASLQDNTIPVAVPRPSANRQAPLPLVRSAPPTILTTTTPGPLHLFDYPANLDFSRHATGHSFKFTAVN